MLQPSGDTIVACGERGVAIAVGEGIVWRVLEGATLVQIWSECHHYRTATIEATDELVGRDVLVVRGVVREKGADNG